jgi:hypothetical protein
MFAGGVELDPRAEEMKALVRLLTRDSRAATAEHIRDRDRVANTEPPYTPPSTLTLPVLESVWMTKGGRPVRADRVEFSWDKHESSWLIRIVAGEEVIQRHFALPESSDEQTLRTAVAKTVADEGYELDPTSLVRR